MYLDMTTFLDCLCMLYMYIVIAAEGRGSILFLLSAVPPFPSPLFPNTANQVA